MRVIRTWTCCTWFPGTHDPGTRHRGPYHPHQRGWQSCLQYPGCPCLTRSPREVPPPSSDFQFCPSYKSRKLDKKIHIKILSKCARCFSSSGLPAEMINNREEDEGVDDNFVKNNFGHRHPVCLAIYSLQQWGLLDRTDRNKYSTTKAWFNTQNQGFVLCVGRDEWLWLFYFSMNCSSPLRLLPKHHEQMPHRFFGEPSSSFSTVTVEQWQDNWSEKQTR